MENSKIHIIYCKQCEKIDDRQNHLDHVMVSDTDLWQDIKEIQESLRKDSFFKFMESLNFAQQKLQFIINKYKNLQENFHALQKLQTLEFKEPQMQCSILNNLISQDQLPLKLINNSCLIYEKDSLKKLLQDFSINEKQRIEKFYENAYDSIVLFNQLDKDDEQVSKQPKPLSMIKQVKHYKLKEKKEETQEQESLQDRNIFANMFQNPQKFLFQTKTEDDRFDNQNKKTPPPYFPNSQLERTTVKKNYLISNPMQKDEYTSSSTNSKHQSPSHRTQMENTSSFDPQPQNGQKPYNYQTFLKKPIKKTSSHLKSNLKQNFSKNVVGKRTYKKFSREEMQKFISDANEYKDKGMKFKDIAPKLNVTVDQLIRMRKKFQQDLMQMDEGEYE